METVIRKKLALRIRELRKKKSWTQEKLSEIAEVDYKHIQLLESKTPPYPRLDTLEKLAKAFEISISELLKF
ncbi:MAG: helix-turn-helix transcriptional regulator [Candidatus Omnitrophica bacterium]|nr:helix-turn-helix transcriptional regulator [Candidatus Omnitrophota bacterium]